MVFPTRRWAGGRAGACGKYLFLEEELVCVVKSRGGGGERSRGVKACLYCRSESEREVLREEFPDGRRQRYC